MRHAFEPSREMMQGAALRVGFDRGERHRHRSLPITVQAGQFTILVGFGTGETGDLLERLPTQVRQPSQLRMLSHHGSFPVFP
jgi:hypothetical protein